MADELGYEREYRPNKLSDFVGNQRIKEEVKTLLMTKVKPHFILISGQSGLGKTTLARIIAKEVRCTNRNTHTGACDTCQSCQQFNLYIQTGDYEELPSLTEIDNGRYSKVEGVRALLDEFNMQKIPGVTRIAIMDEIQTLSRAAQDAMLKSLEEPADNTLFIMCTTAPEYLQSTIVNRAKPHLILAKPKTPELVTYLASILNRENVSYDTQGLEIVASRNDNVPRNSVIALESIVTQRGDAIHNNVVDILDKNNLTDKLFFDFYNSLLNEENKANYLLVIDKARKVADLNTFADKLLAFTKRGLYIQNGINIDGLTKEEMLKYKRLFTLFSIEQISSLLQHIVKLKQGDVETNLFVLGYANLRPSTLTDKLSIVELPNELKQEASVQTESKQALQEEQDELNMKQIESINQSATADEILALLQGEPD